MKKLLNLVANIFSKQEIKEEILPELDREIIGLFDRIDPSKCSIDTYSSARNFTARIKSSSGENISISVKDWEYWVNIEYGSMETIKLKKEEHRTVYSYAQKIIEKVDAFHRKEKEREFIKTLQTDFLG